MFTTIQECIERYKKELKEYNDWLQKAIERNGRKDVLMWGGSDHRRCLEWNTELKAMEAVLGLTEEEVHALNEECGITTSSTD